MSNRPAPLGQLDILDSTGNRLVFDADLAGTGDAMALLVRAGSGERLSVALEPDDVRKLARWAWTVAEGGVHL